MNDNKSNKKILLDSYNNRNAKVAEVLYGSQKIEELLKNYISYYTDYMSKLLERSSLYYSPKSYDSIKGMALHDLVNLFRNLCGNVELISKLDDFAKARNEVVHREFLETTEDFLEAEHHNLRGKYLDSVIAKASECFDLLVVEYNVFISVKDRRIG